MIFIVTLKCCIREVLLSLWPSFVFVIFRGGGNREQKYYHVNY